MPSIAQLLSDSLTGDKTELRDVMRAAYIIFPADDGMWIIFKDRSVLTVSKTEVVVGEIDDWTPFLEVVVAKLGRIAMRHWIEENYPHLAS